MRKPDTTYRLQLSPQYTFEDLKEIVDYLHKLGVSTLYSAPFFQSRKGSTHGYDVMDPFTLNREIGKLEDFKEIGERLRELKLSWLQDIVPNHMAYDGGNVWLKEIFELGPHSPYYNFFDINWKYKGLNKVMAPFLGGTLEEILEKKELKIKFDEKGFSLAYYENVYPLSYKSYAFVLEESEESSFKSTFKEFSGSQQDWEDLKISFLRKVSEDEGLKNKIQDTLAGINDSEEQMKELLDLQFYLPCHWKQTEKEINYRRFFTINDLICLSMENPEVFRSYHSYIKDLCDADLIQGLRIDHIDGLFDPEGYLKSLREMMGNDFYIIVEKILEAGENLPEDWPVQGTSGYEFLAQVNHLFTNSKSEKEFTNFYNKIAPDVSDYEELVYQKKSFILKERMGGELENLMNILKDSELVSRGEADDEMALEEALSAFLAAFPVYRIYPQKFPLKESEREIIEEAYEKAIQKAPAYKSQLDQLKELFFGEAGKDREKMLYFLQRCQQFSGPLAAKGVEDTSFYIYNRLVSHNEVGDSPENFGITVEEFHEKMKHRLESFPLSVNATATHDTKRGEDARMRLNVLSELPQEWFAKVEEWKEINSEVRKNKNVPDFNEEYFIYQTLLGGLSFNEEEDFISRTCDYLQKVLREAKLHSNWAQPNEQYEQDVFEFIKDILNNNKFRKSFDPFHKKIAGFGAIKSLGQTLIKITAPGIPDVYQGTELWDLSYVDPDNRRPVDHNLRKKYITEFELYESGNIKEKLKGIKSDFSNGKIKMFTINKVLLERRSNVELYQKGSYIPLQVTGNSAESFIAYARKLKDNYAIILAPVEVTNIFNPENLEPKGVDDLQVELPDDFPNEWNNIFTGESLTANQHLLVGETISSLPVVLLKNKN